MLIKNAYTCLLVLFVSAIMCVSMASYASADTFGTGANEFTIDFVTISGDTNPTSGYGIVNNDYRMGVYEITNGQWDKFTTELGVAVTGSPSNAYDLSPLFNGTNVATNNVSWYEAAQFVNWLNTSTGHQAAYKFTGTQGQSNYAFDTWSAADADNGTNLYRHKDAFYYLPTEDEWIKAAYWNGATLQTYATKDNCDLNEWRPTGGLNSDGQAAGWNYGYAYPDNSSSTGQLWDVTAGYSPEELNGTYDMMGNAFELMENPYNDPNYGTGTGSGRTLRGGTISFLNSIDLVFVSSARWFYFVSPSSEGYDTGFRVASEIPEPATLSLLLVGGVALILSRSRRKGR